MRRTYRSRRTREELNQDGQDSFLDIVSNIVGILIILVMIAGARVGAIPADQKSLEVAAGAKENVSEISKISLEQCRHYIETCENFEQKKVKIQDFKKTTVEQNTQLELVRQQAKGAEQEQFALATQIDRLETAVSLESEKKDQKEKTLFDLQRASYSLKQQIQELERTKKTLGLTEGKKVTLENIPTPLGKNVDGHEGFFCLRGGRISHVPMNVFTERLRSFFQSYRDVKQTSVDETFGPVENYSFHFQASLHQQRDQNGIQYSFTFDFGECLPESDSIGETRDEMFQPQSQFLQKLSLYLKESSTITLFVYPDSFELLRELKKYLINKGYTIALRPMPENQSIVFSPNGSKSTSY